MKKTVVSILGIRPDFIRMSFVIRELDKRFHHILICSGQHYDPLLCDVFFEKLKIRPPDYILDTGKKCTNHLEQLSFLTTEIPRLFKEQNINPDIICFLGDSNTVGLSFPLKKEGYKIAHIEAGMRSGDRRMLEEINRTVCDHCSDILFVYHEDYKENLRKENIPVENVYVVGNTIVEPLRVFREEIMKNPKKNSIILLDIHRPENFRHKHRLVNIFHFADRCSRRYCVPVKLLYFKRLDDAIKTFGIKLSETIEMVPLMGYEEYLRSVYHSRFIISDSGTGQEEPALLNTPVVVPRDFTERPQSYWANCSISFPAEFADPDETKSGVIFSWIDKIRYGGLAEDIIVPSTKWIGDGTTSIQIGEIMEYFLCNRP